MYNFVCAVPEQLQDVWYLYDLALLAVIGISILMLILLRKRSDLKEAEKSLKTAKTILRKSKAVSARRRRILLFSAKNVFNSAEYHYNLCVSDEDKYEYVAIVEKIAAAVAMLDEILKSNIYKQVDEYSAEIDKILDKLNKQ